MTDPFRLDNLHYAVIAGNKQQYQEWVKTWGTSGDRRRRQSNFTYIHAPEELRGLGRNTKLVLVGTYWKNPAYRSPEMQVVLAQDMRPLIFGDEDFYAMQSVLLANARFLMEYARFCTPFVHEALDGKTGLANDIFTQTLAEAKRRGLLPDDIGDAGESVSSP